MDTFETLRLIAATGCGIQMGGFLMLSLFHQPIFKQWPMDYTASGLFKRFYRFNTAIAIISGVFAIFGEARETGFLLAVLGMSYILLLTHLLPAISNQHDQIKSKKDHKLRRPPEEIINFLKVIQTFSHLSQFIILIYLIYSLI